MSFRLVKAFRLATDVRRSGAFALVAALMQELHRDQKQLFGVRAFRLHFDKQRVCLVRTLDGKLTRACAHGFEKPVLSREEGVLGHFPTPERISDVIPIHETHIYTTTMLVNMCFRT